jgi:hypothetical protein
VLSIKLIGVKRCGRLCGPQVMVSQMDKSDNSEDALHETFDSTYPNQVSPRPA